MPDAFYFFKTNDIEQDFRFFLANYFILIEFKLLFFFKEKTKQYN
jgi:hypothetical protein